MEAGALPAGTLPWLIALLLIVVLLVLLVGLRWKGIEAGPLGMVTAALVALLAFRTPLVTLAVAGGKGLWDAVFILYVVWSTLLLYLVTVRAGAFTGGGAAHPAGVAAAKDRERCERPS